MIKEKQGEEKKEKKKKTDWRRIPDQIDRERVFGKRLRRLNE